MKPSAYSAELAKDQVVEDRDGVKVVFAGGNVFHLHVEDVDTPETRRGANKAWERAEAIRKQLNPNYAGPPKADDPEEQPAASEGAETEGAPSDGEPVDEAPDDNAPPSDADNPPSDDQPTGEPADGQEPAPETPAEEPAPEEPSEPSEPETDEGDEPEDDGEEVQAPETGDEDFTIAGVTAPLRLIPIDLVMDLLGDSQSRVDAIQRMPETQRLHARVSATDGRCAPIFFTQADESDYPALFAGLPTLAAAINLGMEAVAVVIMPSDRAGEAQGAIAALTSTALAPIGEDDELIYRAYSDD
jgi:hypothetical protein